MTWQYPNYGTLLQAYALQTVLEKQGNEVKIINYETQKNNVIILNKYNLKRQIKRLSNFIQKRYTYFQLKRDSAGYKNEIEKREQQFDVFINSELHMTEKLNLIELHKLVKQFDVFVAGSDQIWSPKYLDKSFFLDFVSGKRKLSYAPSFGINDLDDKTIKFIKPLLEELDAISVRELQGLKLIKDKMKLNGTIVLDPTLLLDKEEWITQLNVRKKNKKESQKKYILCYFLGNNEYYWNIVEQVKKKLELQVVIIPYTSEAYRKPYKKIVTGDPFEFIDWIENAEYVITDSFHGTAFAINMGKSFLALARFKDTDYNSENSRVLSLLNIMKLENRWINRQMEIPNEIYISEKCFSKAKHELIEMRNKSIEFLVGNLKNE